MLSHNCVEERWAACVVRTVRLLPSLSSSQYSSLERTTNWLITHLSRDQKSWETSENIRETQESTGNNNNALGHFV